MADPPIISAPVPPSIAGIPQPVIVAGGDSLPPSFPLGTAGTWLPPPQVGFGGNAPFPTPVVPPGVGPTYPQPWFGSGDAATPTAADLFPEFTTNSPSPPIVFANIFNMGNVAPPSTPTTPVIPTAFAQSLGAAAVPKTRPRPNPEPPDPPDPPDPEDEPPTAAKRSHHAKGKPHGHRRH
jgi:hypothetical protein